MGVDIPDIYYDIYSKSDPHDEKIDTKSLDIILKQLSGLSVHLRQQVNNVYLFFLYLKKDHP